MSSIVYSNMIGQRKYHAKKLIGSRMNGAIRQLGSRGVKQLVTAIAKGPDMSEKGISNEHNNEDVQIEPKFQHTKPAKYSNKNSLEKRF